jgi:cellulose synthase/poly-beta-1,6-N-acetylglucosamine synthase-like glycosyltransferase
MMARAHKVSIILAYAGALPFWLLMLAPETVAGFDTVSVFVSYGAIISSFMAGTLWGRAQIEQGDIVLMGLSNVMALIAFVTVMMGLPLAALFVQLTVFGLLLVADFKSLAQRKEHRWYLVLRMRVTLIVAVAYCVVLVDRALTVGL